tara:strand:- start:199 stop:936 length:738 start_codon:yes stop_codon:yes gene_type:complete
MKNTAIIIPSRLDAKRFPNKPLAKINNTPMIIHVLNRAKEAKVGDVFVATPDDEIFQLVNKNGGNAILTDIKHPSGSDRVFEAYNKKLKSKVDLIVNLQGDMPNIKPSSISKLVNLMQDSKCDIGTLASDITNKKDIFDPNIVKVNVDKTLKKNNFLVAKDFFRVKKKINDNKIYHHLGCYIFTKESLSKYVKLPRSNLEIERNLEQMRALENNMLINVGLCDSKPLSVDTKEDLMKVTKTINVL